MRGTPLQEVALLIEIVSTTIAIIVMQIAIVLVAVRCQSAALTVIAMVGIVAKLSWGSRCDLQVNLMPFDSCIPLGIHVHIIGENFSVLL